VIHSTALRTTQADTFGTAVDGGAGAGTLELRTGTSIGSGTLLATFTLNDPSFGSASSGVATANGFPKTVTAAATGTAAHYVIKDSSGTTVGSGLGVAAGSGEVNLVTTSIVSGQPVTLNALTYTRPAGT
jgi:hypothetical protein